MSRIKLAGFVGTIITLLVVVVLMALAHHPIVEVTATCQENGKYLITAVVTNSETVNGTNRAMVIDQVQGGPFSGFGVGTIVLAQGNPPNPFIAVGSVTGTREINGNFSGEYEVRVRVDFAGAGPDNVWGEDSVTLDGSCGQQLNLSHIECTGIGQTVEVHFVNVNGADEDFVTDPGSVSYTLDLNGVVSSRTAAFDGHTGGAMHYREQLPAVDGVYTVISATLTYTTTVGTYTVPLHNPGSVTITGCERQNSVQFTPTQTCEGWEILVSAGSQDYSVVGGPLSGIFTGWDPVVVTGSIEFAVGQPRSFPFEFTFVKAEECQQNTAEIVPHVDCVGWSLEVVSPYPFQVFDDLSGQWNGEWTRPYSIVVHFDHGVPSTITLSGTLFRSEECQTNTASATPSQTCESWQVVVVHSEGGVVTGVTSGTWDQNGQATYDITVSFEHGVPPSFNFTGTLTRDPDCRENNVGFEGDADCEGWEIMVYPSSQDYTLVGGPLSAPWGQDEWTRHVEGSVEFAVGQPRSFPFSFDFVRPEECQENWASYEPTQDCEAWNLNVIHSDGGSVTGATSGGWDQNGQASYSVVVSFAHGVPASIPFEGMLTRDEICNPTATPTPTDTPENTPTNTPEMTSTPEFTPTNTPPAPPVTPAQPAGNSMCVLEGSQTWPPAQYSVYWNNIVSWDSERGIYVVSPFDGAQFVTDGRMGTIFKVEQNGFAFMDYQVTGAVDGVYTCSPVTPPVMPAAVPTDMPPCDDCGERLCEAYAQGLTITPVGIMTRITFLGTDPAALGVTVVSRSGEVYEPRHTNDTWTYIVPTGNYRFVVGGDSVTPDSLDIQVLENGLQCTICSQAASEIEAVDVEGRRYNLTFSYGDTVSEYSLMLMWEFRISYEQAELIARMLNDLLSLQLASNGAVSITMEVVIPEPIDEAAVDRFFQMHPDWAR